MKTLKGKLKNNSGASMILALALLLICVMVSSVILVSASSGTNRLQQRIEKQRDYFAVSSAAQFIAENLDACGQFVATKRNYTYGCEPYKNFVPDSRAEYLTEDAVIYDVQKPSNYLDGQEVENFYLVLLEGESFCTSYEEEKMIEGEGATVFEGAFAELMKEAAFYVFKHGEDGQDYVTEFTMEVENEGDRLPKVLCRFKMNANYHVELEISSTSGNSDYSIDIILDANPPAIDPNGVTEETICYHRYFYTYTDQVGNIQTVYPQEVWELKDYVTSETTTITWQKPEIIKGVD